MKIRNGFVSNSSTSSFLIYGIAIERDKLREMLSKKLEQSDKKDSDEDNHYDLIEKVLPYGNKTGIEYHIPYSDTIYIGRSWDDIKDDETGKQFKENTEAKMRELIIGNYEDVEFATHKEAWRDG